MESAKDPRAVRFGIVPTTRLLTQRRLLSQWSAVTTPTEWVSCVDYAELLRRVLDRSIDCAWLPPVTYLRALEAGVVEPVYALRRAGVGRYVSALICSENASYARVEDLHGARAAWVDPWSAAGYIMPRRMVRDAGLHPDRDLWQRVVGSYSNALEAIALNDADIAGIYCSVDAFRTIVRSGWTGADRVRVLAISEPIAGDVLVRVVGSRPALVDAWVAALGDAARAPEHKGLLWDVFGADDVGPMSSEDYQPLADALRGESIW
ncbi:MAG: PhnD/SsuA/transferrin family substrate-binding protein [Deltaproteobacteria bacterium]|nr:PhnD/SsuA/transferrin family substrate-binding protein [Deltaproteobacteria bacterium]